MLFSVGGLFALYEAWHKFADPHADRRAGSGCRSLVLVVAIVLESFSFRTAIVESNQVRGNASWVQFVRRARAPELPVVLLEDLGALLGLVFALFGVAHDPDHRQRHLGRRRHRADRPAAGRGRGRSWRSRRRACCSARAPTPEDVAAIEQAILAGDEVERIIHMKTLHLGPEELLVAAKIAVPARRHAPPRSPSGIDAAEARIRAAVPIARVIYLEPDIYASRDRRRAGAAAGRRRARPSPLMRAVCDGPIRRVRLGLPDGDRRAAGPAGADRRPGGGAVARRAPGRAVRCSAGQPGQPGRR